MIAQLRGTVEEVFDTFIIIDVNGVGFEVFTNTRDLSIIKGNKIKLYIYTNVYQDGIKLYGFKTKFEMKIFKDLLKVSKIGPKTAFTIVANTEARELVKSIKDGNVGYLTSVKGVGKKAAERILVELSEREFQIDDFNLIAKNEALEALLNLGFDRSKIYEVLKGIEEDENTELILKQALKELGK